MEEQVVQYPIYDYHHRQLQITHGSFIQAVFELIECWSEHCPQPCDHDPDECKHRVEYVFGIVGQNAAVEDKQNAVERHCQEHEQRCMWRPLWCAFLPRDRTWLWYWLWKLTVIVLTHVRRSGGVLCVWTPSSAGWQQWHCFVLSAHVADRWRSDLCMYVRAVCGCYWEGKQCNWGPASFYPIFLEAILGLLSLQKGLFFWGPTRKRYPQVRTTVKWAPEPLRLVPACFLCGVVNLYVVTCQYHYATVHACHRPSCKLIKINQWEDDCNLVHLFQP